MNTSSTTADQQPVIQDIEEIHNLAIQQKQTTYIDPPTGYTVLTEYSHLKRGKCCGNKCRHCPYGWENVKFKNYKTGQMESKVAKVQSGDKVGVKKLLLKIESGDIPPTITPSSSPSSCCTSTDHTHKHEQPLESRSTMTHYPNDNSDNTSKKSTKASINAGRGGRYGGKLTAKNVPYTRSGDAGTSILITGERRSKDDLAFEAMGTVDELCSIVGTVHGEVSIGTLEKDEDYDDMEEWLLDIMSRLFDIGSHIAKPPKLNQKQSRRQHGHDDNVKDESDYETDTDDEDDNKSTSTQEQEQHVFIADGVGGGFDEEHVEILENWIDTMTEELPELNSFILPTGGRVSAQLHVARTVCRRAERRSLPLVRAGLSDPNALQYLNRLSDFFFTAARYANYCEGRDEVTYRRHMRGDTQRNRFSVRLREEKKSQR